MSAKSEADLLAFEIGEENEDEEEGEDLLYNNKTRIVPESILNWKNQQQNLSTNKSLTVVSKPATTTCSTCANNFSSLNHSTASSSAASTNSDEDSYYFLDEDNNNNNFQSTNKTNPNKLEYLSSVDHPHTRNNKSLFSYFFYTNTNTVLNKFVMSYEDQLHKAIVKANFELVSELVEERRCDVNVMASKRLPLGLAAEYNSYPVVELLLKVSFVFLMGGG